MQTTFNYDHYYDWLEMSECLTLSKAVSKLNAAGKYLCE